MLTGISSTGMMKKILQIEPLQVVGNGTKPYLKVSMQKTWKEDRYRLNINYIRQVNYRIKEQANGIQTSSHQSANIMSSDKEVQSSLSRVSGLSDVVNL